jgi:hypothetical protein
VVPIHKNGFLLIVNGAAATRLASFPQLDFKSAMSRVCSDVVGQRWNSQHTWGVASLNIKQSNPRALVGRPTAKKANVTDGILPQFAVLSSLLLEIDPNNEFYCGRKLGNERRIRHARQLMDADTLLPEEIRESNVIESLSGISNLYCTTSQGDMYSGVDVDKVCSDHSTTSSASSSGGSHGSTKKDIMKSKFAEWGIKLKWVITFPHVDDFNGREVGQNFLGCVSRTVTHGDDLAFSRFGVSNFQRQAMTFCQRKVNEDTQIREKCAKEIYRRMRQWMLKQLPDHRKGEKAIIRFALSIYRQGLTDEMEYRATHVNKCVYYSIFCSDQRKVIDRFQLGLARQIEALAVLILCNGPDKHHLFFNHLYERETLPVDTLPSVFARYCNSSLGGSVMSLNYGKRHRPHFMRPYLKAEMLYGLRVLLSIIEDVNAGKLSKQEAKSKVIGEVKFAGDLIANHLFAVAVLRGLIIDREYLTKPVVAHTLCRAVRTSLFQDGDDFSDDRIRTATERASFRLGINVMAGEHALCEIVRLAKDESPGNDGFCNNQDFLWISQKNGHDATITELRRIDNRTVRVYRTMEDDQITFEEIPKEDSNEIKHRWWIPEPNRHDCLLHFVRECECQGGNPMEVIYPSSKASDKSTKKEETKLWTNYITAKSKANNINIEELPDKLCCVSTLHPTSMNKKQTGINPKIGAARKKSTKSTVPQRRAKDSTMTMASSTQSNIPSNTSENDQLKMVRGKDSKKKKGSQQVRATGTMRAASILSSDNEPLTRRLKTVRGKDSKKIGGTHKNSTLPQRRGKDCTTTMAPSTQSNIPSNTSENDPLKTVRGKDSKKKKGSATGTMGAASIHSDIPSNTSGNEPLTRRLKMVHGKNSKKRGRSEEVMTPGTMTMAPSTQSNIPGNTSDDDSFKTVRGKESKKKKGSREERSIGRTRAASIHSDMPSNTSDNEPWTRRLKTVHGMDSKKRGRSQEVMTTSTTMAPSNQSNIRSDEAPDQRTPTIKFDLYRDAQKALHDCYGILGLELVSFGDNYPGIGTVWTGSVKLTRGKNLYTTTDYVPSVLDPSAICLPNDDGFAFRNVKSAERALLWWIICTQQVESNRKIWASNLLGGHGSVTLVTLGLVWCTLFLNDKGEYWVQCNGRKRRIA